MKEAVSKIPAWIITIGTIFFLFLIVDSMYISKKPIMIFGQEFGFKTEKADDKKNNNSTDASREEIINDDNEIIFKKASSYHVINKENIKVLDKKMYYSTSKGLGLVTEKPIPLKIGSELELFLRADDDFGSSPDGVRWRVFFNIGLLKHPNSENSETLKELASEVDSIMFSLAPTPAKNEEYKEKLSIESKRSKHELSSSYDNESTSYFNVFHEPKKWNKITLSFFDKSIKLYINNELAVDYKGYYPDAAFFSIHEDHTSMSHSIRKNILINYSHKILSIR